ncbi:recombinase family protein [Legionella rowbothamii]|uniref:recombinase family protein n=1 Tax=Legionella rowbothamii TaxID=96229 RepID=UPI001056755D|nr:recombinase family protein [Legionella rowbothamii]
MKAGVYARVSTHDQHTLGMQIDVIIVWKLDRWGRSINDLFHTIHQLSDLGVGFISLTGALDLTTATGRGMAGLLAIFAEFEREILRERVKAGIAHARSNGKAHGRPATAKTIKISSMFKMGLSQSEMSRTLDIGRAAEQTLNNV